MAREIILILGGARSGKSQFAQELAARLGKKVLFVATGEPRDEEMQARIDKHRKSRPEGWRTVESPTGVGKRLEAEAGDCEVVLVDCLTLLVSNLLCAETDCERVERLAMAELDGLFAAMKKLDASFIIVSNEVGMGLVPENPLGRVYRDLLGKVNQLVARQATEVYFLAAGIPVKIK